jgi:hypothetical protein
VTRLLLLIAAEIVLLLCGPSLLFGWLLGVS